MSQVIVQRLKALRDFMKDKGLDAFIIPTTDAHLSEYPAPYWMSREWISGFTGSAGTVVVTLEKAGLWTDSRYFIQAEQELIGTTIDLYKEKLPKTPTIDAWLVGELKAGSVVGIDQNVYAAKDYLGLNEKLTKRGLLLNGTLDPFASIRNDRPQIPTNTIFELPVEYAGLLPSEKISKVCDELEKEGADSTIVSSLDSIAWLFNIRGNDVTYNPVAVAYAFVSRIETVLFINPQKLTKETTTFLQSQGVTLAEYDKVFDFVAALKDRKIAVSPSKITYSLYSKISSSCQIIDILSPVEMMKSMKNETEIAGFRSAMVRDGAALVKFYIWLEKNIAEGTVTEWSIGEKLIEYRAQQDLYVGESFGTIAGYEENGALPHYKVTESSSKTIRQANFLLIDSGAQYFDGTTDITRTWVLGELTDQMKKDYTNVLKGHISLATCRFPVGTRGSQIDVLARQFLWNNGQNYLHGTGHGIGHFLNVHEGPQSIRMEENSVTLELGMVMSNEPGLYKEGEYGIRTENLMLVKKFTENEFGTFYEFETLTLCPIDTTPIDKALMSASDIDWLNDYHAMVYDRLSPSLNEDEKSWLKEKTKAI